MTFDFTNFFFWLERQQKFYSKVIVICISLLNQRSLGLEGLFEYVCTLLRIFKIARDLKTE